MERLKRVSYEERFLTIFFIFESVRFVAWVGAEKLSFVENAPCDKYWEQNVTHGGFPLPPTTTSTTTTSENPAVWWDKGPGLMTLNIYGRVLLDGRLWETTSREGLCRKAIFE